MARVAQEPRAAVTDGRWVVGDRPLRRRGHELRESVAINLGDALIHVAVRSLIALQQVRAEVLREDRAQVGQRDGRAGDRHAAIGPRARGRPARAARRERDEEGTDSEERTPLRHGHATK